MVFCYEILQSTSNRATFNAVHYFQNHSSLVTNMDSPSVTVKAENMDEMYKLAKTKLTSNMFAKFSEIREAELVSDFEIRVENKTFLVHRFILIAASEYFRAMVMSNMKEAEQKFVEMKEVNTEGIKYCLEFIYTGEIDMSKAPVKSILHASHLMQINDLTDLCFGYLMLNISTDSCISTLKLSQFYDRNDVKNIINQYILDHWKEVALTDDFPSLEQEDLISYLKESKDYTSSWKAVVRWLDDKNENVERLLLQLMKTVEIKNFPFEFLLKTVLNDPLVQRCQKAHNKVISLLFSNSEHLKKNILLETVFPLRKLAKANLISDSNVILNVLSEFIEDNFERLAQKEEIGDLDEKEIVDLFESKNLYFPEKIKFIATVKWTRKNPRQRRKTFPKLFKLIKLKHLSSDFIQQNIRSESLVKESPECLNHMLDHLARTPVPHIACLYRETIYVNTGEVKLFNLSNNQWSRFCEVPMSYIMNIVTVGNVLYLLNNEDLLVLQEDGTWLKKASIPVYPHCVVSFQDRIYVINENAMSCYDPMQNTWDTNLPGCGLDAGFCVAALGECIYAIGGVFTYNEAKKFDPNTRIWSEITSMKIPRDAASAAALDGKVFVMGGYEDGPLNNVDFYDPTRQQWYEAANLCRHRDYFSSCVVKNKLYAVGGSHDTNNKHLDPDSIEVYNQELGKWEIVCKMENSDDIVFCCAIYL